MPSGYVVMPSGFVISVRMLKNRCFQAHNAISYCPAHVFLPNATVWAGNEKTKNDSVKINGRSRHLFSFADQYYPIFLYSKMKSNKENTVKTTNSAVKLLNRTLSKVDLTIDNKKITCYRQQKDNVLIRQ